MESTHSPFAARVLDWEPPTSWRSILTVDLHTEGEPLRVIFGGFPRLEGVTILERRNEARTLHDACRRTLMWEPRGHADMYGALVVPPVSENADVGVLFMHNEGFSTMCGHGIIGLATVLVELELVEVVSPVTRIGIDTPAGFVDARVEVDEFGVEAPDEARAGVGHAGPRRARAGRVTFTNVDSFAARLDAEVDVPGRGTVRYDLAYGGAFYAYVDAADFGFRLVPGEAGRLAAVGRAIKDAVQASAPPRHPDHDDLGFMYGTIFVGPADDPRAHSRNVCVFADGEIDRSPTGTGVSGRLAVHHARDEIGLGEEIVIESRQKCICSGSLTPPC